MIKRTARHSPIPAAERASVKDEWSGLIRQSPNSDGVVRASGKRAPAVGVKRQRGHAASVLDLADYLPRFGIAEAHDAAQIAAEDALTVRREGRVDDDVAMGDRDAA